MSQRWYVTTMDAVIGIYPSFAAAKSAVIYTKLTRQDEGFYTLVSANSTHILTTFVGTYVQMAHQGFAWALDELDVLYGRAARVIVVTMRGTPFIMAEVGRKGEPDGAIILDRNLRTFIEAARLTANPQQWGEDDANDARQTARVLTPSQAWADYPTAMRIYKQHQHYCTIGESVCSTPIISSPIGKGTA